MSPRRTLVSLVTAMVLVLSAPAAAQDPVGLTSELERTASATPQEKQAYAVAAKAEIADAAKQIARMLEAAKKDGDATAIQCITSRLTAVRALQTVCDNAEAAMITALSSGVLEKADHEFRRIAVALTKTRSLLAEAQRCSVDQAVASGDTVISVGADDLIDPGEDPGVIDPTDWGDIPLVTAYF